MSFQGVDCYAPPNADELRALKASGVAWIAAYLPAPSHSDDAWPDFATLTDSGLNVLPLWVGGQVVGPGSHNVSGVAGASEGQDCVAALALRGYPPGHGVAFDTENGPPMPDEQIAHVAMWAGEVRAGGYRPLIYGSHLNQAILELLVGAENVWVFWLTDEPPDPLPAPVVQWKQNTTIPQNSDAVDLNVSAWPDPANAPIRS